MMNLPQNTEYARVSEYVIFTCYLQNIEPLWNISRPFFLYPIFKNINMGESPKIPKIFQNLQCQLNIHNLKFKWSIVFRQTEYKSENLL